MILKHRQVKFGFTLAEVLITLGIIGIIAAMTIPTLMNSTNEKELIFGWKKNFSVISQAWMMVIQDNGGSGSISSNTGQALNNDYGNALIAKLNSTKICLAGSPSATNSECWHKANDWWTLNKSPINNGYSTNFSAILNDGTYISVGNLTNNCPDNNVQCTYMGVDVNGSKSPNIQGKDIFYLSTWGGGRVIPHNVDKDPSDPIDPYNCVESSTVTSSSEGQGCSRLALYCDNIDYATGKCK